MFREYVELFEALSLFYKYSLDICDCISLDSKKEVVVAWRDYSYKFDSLKSKVDKSLKKINSEEMSYNSSLNKYYNARDCK